MSYLVCASQRSGTELLCRGLAATGVAGLPPGVLPRRGSGQDAGLALLEEGPYAAGHDVSDRESYLTLAYRLGSTPNGVFGAKIQELPAMGAGEVLGDAPLRRPGPSRDPPHRVSYLRVVDVMRRDRVRQAVSWARMAQDGMWVAPVGQPEPAWPPRRAPRYDYALIAALEALIAESETGWRQLYDELGLTPYQVVYEELSTPDGYQKRSGRAGSPRTRGSPGPVPGPPDPPSIQRPERGLGGRLPRGQGVPPGALTLRHQVHHAAAPDQQDVLRLTWGRFRIPENANTCLGLTGTFTA